MAIVIFLPEILPCRTACAMFEFRTKRICLLPTMGVTLNSTWAGEAANGLTSACAVPLPAIDFLHTAVLAIRSSSEALQTSRPLVETFSELGSVIVICLAVVRLSRLLVTDSLSFSDFGLDFVPALLGETPAVAWIEGAGVWAYATPATPRASAAVPAAMKVLRKRELLGIDVLDCEAWACRTAPRIPMNTRKSKRLRC